jgi:hypothetical protein
MTLFGFSLSKKKKDPVLNNDDPVSFVPPMDQDGTTVIASSGGAGYYGQFVDIDGTTITNERDLILKYRAAATQPECDSAISDIVNAAIVSDDNSAPVSLILDELDDFNESIKKKITEEFENVVSLLNFNEKGQEYFRRWYVDGRMYFHIIPNQKNPKNGIEEIREIEPTRVKKVREITTKVDRATGVKTVTTTAEYFQYTEGMGADGSSVSTASLSAVKINPDSIVYVPSGLVDETRKVVTSNLHKSLKIVNQLRMMEDSLVIYRISRAPERRIFYIDVGNLPKGKSEEYVQSIMSKYRNKLVYDAATGDIRDDRKSMSMLEDFWLPRKEGGRGTEITTLPGGDNLGQIEDVIFFQKKLYRSLNVPISRLEGETGFNLGRSTEISRDEVKFHKFVTRLRQKFAYLLINLLHTQLILKGIVTEEDWESIKENIAVDFAEDNYFSELKEFEILRERITMLDQVTPHIGKYFSDAWVRTNILRQTQQDIKRIDAEIAKETPPPSEEPPAAEGDAADGADGGDEGDTSGKPTGDVHIHY